MKWKQLRSDLTVLYNETDGAIHGSVTISQRSDTIGIDCAWTARVEYGRDAGKIADFVSRAHAKDAVEQCLHVTVTP